MTDKLRLTVADGRTLVYAEYGLADGHPVLYFHGSPSSRLEPLIIGDLKLAELGLRVIAPDRPGMGLSDFQPNRGFTDWVADVTCLADSLGLPKFSVLGNSGGGGYVAVCAARIPARLHSAVIVSGGWRMDSRDAGRLLKGTYKMNWFVSKYAPFLLQPMLKMIGKAGDKPSQNLGPMERTMASPDVKAVAQGDRLQRLMKSLAEAVRLGAKGAAWDMRMYFRPWNFDPAEITMPLSLFHGDMDRNFPIPLARSVVSTIPSANLTVYPQEAHLSTLVNHFGEIANSLLLNAN